MIFPITELLSEEESERWLARYFHPHGVRCPRCKMAIEEARVFRRSQRGLLDYRCKHCDRVYNLYTGTVFAYCGLSARQAVLLVGGVCKGESSAALAEELEVSRTTVHALRQKLQANGAARLNTGRLPDTETETDEMFQNAGEKRRTARRSQRSAPPARQQAQGARHLRE